MMRYVKYAIISVVVAFVAGFLYYTLPRHDVVRVIDTYQQRTDLTGWTRIFWSGSTKNQQLGQGNRDVQFIQAVRPNGKTVVYRNEDTGWGWPPYFKFDTATMQARAADLKSTSADPKWVVITRYGWRNDLLSIFPNAMSIEPVDSPDVTIVPWFNIFFFAGLIVLVLLTRTLWKLYVQRVWRPFVDRWK